jgi:hypothetical protein
VTARRDDRPTLHHRRARILSIAAVLIGVAGCGNHSTADVDGVARSVPAPSGLTFTGITDQTYQDGLGAATHEANAGYSNPLMPCSQLRAGWVSTLQAAHWTIDNGKSTSSVISIKHHGYTVTVGLNNVTTCNQTIVNVR